MLCQLKLLCRLIDTNNDCNFEDNDRFLIGHMLTGAPNARLVAAYPTGGLSADLLRDIKVGRDHAIVLTKNKIVIHHLPDFEMIAEEQIDRCGGVAMNDDFVIGLSGTQIIQFNHELQTIATFARPAFERTAFSSVSLFENNVVASSSNGGIAVWDVRSGQPTGGLKIQQNFVDVSIIGNSIVSAGKNGDVFVFDARNFRKRLVSFMVLRDKSRQLTGIARSIEFEWLVGFQDSRGCAAEIDLMSGEINRNIDAPDFQAEWGEWQGRPTFVGETLWASFPWAFVIRSFDNEIQLPMAAAGIGWSPSWDGAFAIASEGEIYHVF